MSVGTPLLWFSFTAFVLVMLALDLGVFHKTAHEIKMKEAAAWSAFWIFLSLAFNFIIYLGFGGRVGLEFLTGYLIEKALSVDNIFVFLVIMSYFAVAPKHQHRVLYWGIMGALVMRAIFIFGGAWLLDSFHFATYIFGAFLIFTGFRLMVQAETKVEPHKNILYRIFHQFIPIAKDYQGAALWIREGGKWRVTPLLLVILVVEATDIVFAADSIPAIFAVTHDPFIVFTSNIFAILGLRALYFLLASVMKKFHYLSLGLAFVLIFVGIKMSVEDFYPISIGWSLGGIAGILGIALLASFLRQTKTK